MGDFFLDGVQFAQLESGIFDEPDFAAGEMLVNEDGHAFPALALDLAEDFFALEH